MDNVDVDNLLGQTLVGDDGEKIGKIEDIYLDADSRTPEWALVHTGLFGRRESFVPLGDATVVTGGVHVPYTKARVKDAPSAEPDGNLSAEEEDELYRHYGMSDEALNEMHEMDDTERIGQDPTDTNDDPPSLVRSEERLNVTTQRRPSRTVRLRKSIVVENVTMTVPVRREVLEVIDDGEAGEAGDIVREVSGEETPADVGEEVGEIILHEERPVVTLETVATERVRVGRETNVEDTTLTHPVQKERVYVEETPVHGDRDD